MLDDDHLEISTPTPSQQLVVAGDTADESTLESRVVEDERKLQQQHQQRSSLNGGAGWSLPEDDVPYWLREKNPLANFQSQASLPKTADVVIVGAGLAGASACYHMVGDGNKENLTVVILDQGDPACEASGRNGGNFESLPENCIGDYEGLVTERRDFLRLVGGNPRDAERQAVAVQRLAAVNHELLSNIIEHERIECDFSPRGWLFIAKNATERAGIEQDAKSNPRIEIWSDDKIAREFGFGLETRHGGRFIETDGSYHPFKYVCGTLEAAIRRGAQLFTRTRVLRVLPAGGVETDRGSIRAKHVVVATNAFTRELLPDLATIHPRSSQVMFTEQVKDRTRGRIVTSDIGPIYFNQPGGDSLLLGGGPDALMHDPRTRTRSRTTHAMLLRLRDTLYPELAGREPSAEWIGPMAFTPDQLPAIGFYDDHTIVIAAFCGYGGSFATAAGKAAADMIATGKPPRWAPEDVFGIQRLIHPVGAPYVCFRCNKVHVRGDAAVYTQHLAFKTVRRLRGLGM